MIDLDYIHFSCALWRTPRVGYKRFAKIMMAFDSPKSFFSASSSQREKLGVKVDSTDLLKAQKNAEKDIYWLQNTEYSHILTQNNPYYPERLLEISDPPPVLFVRGDISLLSEPQLAIVGSRSPSHEGAENARSFATYLAKNGIVITSGMALGIDGESHKGALQAGKTIAVMGTGPDRIYPAKHHELAHAIIDSGLIVTELPVGTPIRVDSFPRRNRIISGLSLGTLVVEASTKSGSLITANLALDQGREVFAIPGSIHNPLAKGCNHLIKKGAKLVETAEDIFEELKPQLLAFIDEPKSDRLKMKSGQLIENRSNGDLFDGMNHNNTFEIHSDKKENKSKNIPLLDDDDKKVLWESLSHDPQPVDVLIQRSGLSASDVSSMLLIFELDGYVMKSAGGLYQKMGM